MTPMDHVLTQRTIGWVASAHGLRGEVQIKPCDADVPWRKRLKQVILVQPHKTQQLALQSVRWQGSKLVVKFQEINTRGAAEALKGAELKALESDLPPLKADEFYTEDLVGLTVYSQDSGLPLGTVVDILSASATDFLEVSTPNLRDSVLVPFQDPFILHVDKVEKRVLIQGLDSLFEPV